MKKRIITYWLLLLIPTAVIAAAAFQLLHHEQERINQQARLSARDRAQTIGDTLMITVGAVEDELTQALKAIPAESIAETLSRWEVQNPLIRNGFIWDPVDGLVKPLPDDTATAEEVQFINRYHALITGRIPWQSAVAEGPGSQRAGAMESPDRYRSEGASTRDENSSLGKLYPKNPPARRKLMELARGNVAEPSAKMMVSDAVDSGAYGWIPWFTDNSLYLLGWVQRLPNSLVYGVELEVMTLLSRLILDFPRQEALPAGMVFGLIDGSGKILHQAGSAPIHNSDRPEITVPLSPHLPHWQVAVYFAEEGTAIKPGRGFFLLSLLLLAVFITAILLGAALLTWQALRNLKDARRKTSFVSNVSHELKTPLTSIRMYAELLKEDRIQSPAKKKEYLNVIVDESQRLTRLVNNVLDFSRLEQGRKQYRIKELDMPLFLHEIIDAHLMRLEQAGLVLIKQIPDSTNKVQTDRDTLEQVLLNLIDNAIKYAAEGKELKVSLESTAEACRIKVQDRGPGVPTPHRSKIFDKFHRVDDSLTARQPGSGLGLSIARRLLRDIGGDLQFEPRPDGGSSFIVIIPL